MLYSFECEKCEEKFEISVDMDKIIGYKAKCPSCKSQKTYRDYRADGVRLKPPDKTLGSYADKKKMSDEAKLNILNKNRREKSELPEGVSRFKRDDKGKITTE